MLQLTQNLKTGVMELSEVPYPAMDKNKILVRNHFSLISSGTEISKVSTARKGYLGKAKEKPEQVKQVLDTIRNEGIISTYHKVMNKLDALSPLGYSSAGTVMAVGENVAGFCVGDRVACGGQDIANHAEVIAVPANLASRIPEGVTFEEAAFTTVAAIALQGIRQADLRLGEYCLVIGLGLIGQLTIQMLKAAGINVAGVDINPDNVRLSGKSGIDLAFNRDDPQAETGIVDFSGGYGVDATIITAGSSSLDPIELAGRMCRSKGRVIIVGAVPTGFGRENYYKKELELRMSCSYGPGRYNPSYEFKGVDLPIGYVRWTENRNMQAFLKLVATRKVDPAGLVSHIVAFEQAVGIYDTILAKSEPVLGVLLKYDQEKIPPATITALRERTAENLLRISFIGAGSFAQNSLLPNIKEGSLVSVATAESHSSRSVAAKFGFLNALDSGEAVAAEPDSNVLFIATRHDTHFRYVIEGIRNNKHVFVEKPLCMSADELELIREAYSAANIHLMVGFNRRFSPHIQKMKKVLEPGIPVAINYRINAGYVPPDHWTQDPDFGGGRIIGEVCHFIDLAIFLASSMPSRVNAFAMKDPLNLNDTLTITLSFVNGSIATIQYYSNGSKTVKKEYLEVFSAGSVMTIDDFRTLDVYGKKHYSMKLMNQDKGHKEEVHRFLAAIRSGSETPIRFSDIYASAFTTFKVLESLRENKAVGLDFNTTK